MGNEVKTEDKPEAVYSEEIADAFGVPSSTAKTTSSISDEEFGAILKKSNLFEVIKLMKENLPNDPIEIMDPTESISNELIPCLLSTLSQKEKISFKFAQMIMGILVTKDLIRPVSILVAKVLPDSQNQNAMKNLYAYDSINRILYLKQSLLKVRSNASIQLPVAFTDANTDMDMTMTQYKDAFDPRLSQENVSERLEAVNYQIALAIRAGLPVEELQKEQVDLQLKIMKR